MSIKKHVPTKKEQKLAIIITIITIVVLAGITYTFFSAAVSNTNNEKLITQTATMSLVFDDNDNGVNANLNLGESIVKKFTLENTGTVDAYGKINWYNLVNTYTPDSLTWTLEQSTTENGAYTSVGAGTVPTSSTSTMKKLKSGILVPANTTYYYKLTIKLNNLDIDQSSDINASMHSQFSLVSSSRPGTDVINSLVAGKPSNTTKEIDLTEYNPGDKYTFSFNGAITLDEYTNFEDCQANVKILEERFGTNVNFTCQENSVTSEYFIEAHGVSNHSADSGSDIIFDTQEDCELAITDDWGFENTTCTSNLIPKNVCTNTLAYDGTIDNNLRYVGANPCNYVTFNGESPVSLGLKWVEREKSSKDEFNVFDTENECLAYLQNNRPNGLYDCVQREIITGGWRIVGVMNNIDNGSGNKETRIKLVRNEPLTGGTLWDSSDSSINYGEGINDWTQADLMQELNGDYLNTSLNENTFWYDGYSNEKWGTSEYDYTKGLKTETQNLIENAKWHLGGHSTNMVTASLMYEYERGKEVWGSTAGQTCNDDACPRATSWTGKVALLYPSDYGFAVGGKGRNTCLTNTLDYYYNYDCKSNNWLKPKLTYYCYWLLSPSSDNAQSLFTINYFGGIWVGTNPDFITAELPAIYLKSEANIIKGDGTPDNPYVFK